MWLFFGSTSSPECSQLIPLKRFEYCTIRLEHSKAHDSDPRIDNPINTLARGYYYVGTAVDVEDVMWWNVPVINKSHCESKDFCVERFPEACMNGRQPQLSSLLAPSPCGDEQTGASR